MKGNGNLISDIFGQSLSFGEKIVCVYRTEFRRFPYSYKRVHDLSLRCARFLEERGVQEGDKVILWAPNSPAWMIAYWGILARGAVVVPVDFASDYGRASFISEKSGARFIFQSSRKTTKFEGENTVLIESLEDLLVSIEPARKIPHIDSDAIAEIVYTSGTTGDPKGVVLTHKNILANISQIDEYLGKQHFRRPVSEFTFLSVLPLSHMLEQTASFLLALRYGAKIVYLGTLKPSALAHAIEEERIHALVLVPRLLQVLRGSIEQKFARIGLLGAFSAMNRGAENLPLILRRILHFPLHRFFGFQFELLVSGGASLDAPVAAFWSNAGFLLIEGYGLTECAPVLTAQATGAKARNVGKALPGVEISLAPDGEILAKGDNISPGYYDGDAIKSNRLPNGGWFPTGDLGSIDSEGNLTIRGRKKDLIVTSSGINVSPESVEEALAGIQGIREACVIGLSRGEGEEVHAVLILEEGIDPGSVVERANAKLDPEERITSFSSWPDASFPRTTTLKVKRFEVQKRMRGGALLEGSGTAKDRLLDLISQSTKVDPSQIREESLLAIDLGLTSIGRLELAGLIEQEFRIDFEDTLINEKTSVADLRRLILGKRKGEKGDHLHPFLHSSFLTPVRFFMDYLFHIPVFSYFLTWKVEGLKHLIEAMNKGPVILAANHLSFGDHGAIWYAIPPKYRYRIATAAWEEFFFRNSSFLSRALRYLAFLYAGVFYNTFVLSQEKGFRKSLKHMGYLVEHGKSILIFPEGERSRDGRMLPLQQGIGLIGKELAVPIIPVKIEGMEKVFHRDARFPQRGNVRIAFGVPLETAHRTSTEIIEVVRERIASL